MQMKNSLLAGIVLLTTIFAISSVAEDTIRVDVAEFDGDGNLVVPADIDTWVFLGSSLGMGYSQENFDPDTPGMFQIVRMEPEAYGAFVETGEFVDGTMIALQFYGSENHISTNRSGFVMGGLHTAEIHYKDSKYPQGFNFFMFGPDSEVATEVALPNECVECHQRDGAYDGVFVQFYPDMQRFLPAEVQERLKQEPSAH